MRHDNEHQAALRRELENRHGQVYDQSELMEYFWIQAFVGYEFVRVQHKTTGEVGTLQYVEKPRFYFHWVTLQPLS